MAYDETTVAVGKNLYFGFGTIASETSLNDNGYIKSVDWPDDVKVEDVTGSGAYEHSKAGQRKNVSVTVVALCTSGAAGAANPVATLVGAIGTEAKGMVFGPGGNGTGMPKRHFVSGTGSCFVTGVSYKATGNGGVEATIKIQTTGAPTDTAF